MKLRTIVVLVMLGVLGWIGYSRFYKPYRQENAEQKQLEEAFLKAVLEGDVHRAERLLDAGVDINAKDKYGRTAIQIATGQGWNQMVKLLQARSAKAREISQTHRRVHVRRST
jgi:predicted negative regulator of RcsB-dependent stress response